MLKMIKEEIAEEKEIESRKLNVTCFIIPESNGSDVKERQNEDKDFFINLLDTKLSYSLGEEDIIKPVRLGKRSEIMNQSYKCRLLRFSVRSFQVKRELFKASMSLRETNAEMLSNIYFTPDFTKCQRAESFKLREERRYCTNELYESKLKISQGCIIKKNWESCAFNRWCPEWSWATCGWYKMHFQ